MNMGVLFPREVVGAWSLDDFCGLADFFGEQGEPERVGFVFEDIVEAFRIRSGVRILVESRLGHVDIVPDGG